MEILLNHQTHQVPDQYSLQQLLLAVLPETQDGIAVAVNQDVIPSSDWHTTLLQQHDDVCLIRATQGG